MWLRTAFVFALCFVIVAGPYAIAYGQGTGLPDRILPERIVPKCGEKSICGLCDFVQLANNILTAIIYLSVFLAAVLFAYAGFQYMTAYGEPGKIKAAHEIFRNVGLGLVIVLAAWLIIDTLMRVLTGNETWSRICG